MADAETHERAVNPAERASGTLMLLLAVYLLMCGNVAIALGLEAYSGSYRFVGMLISPSVLMPPVNPTVPTLLYSVSGAIIGAVLLSLRGLYRHGAVLNDFKRSYAGAYLIGPWAAGLLGLAVYVLARAGMLTFGGTSDLKNLTEAGELSYLGVGILVGFAWEKVLNKLDAVADQVFTTTQKAPSQPGGARGGVPDGEGTTPDESRSGT